MFSCLNLKDLGATHYKTYALLNLFKPENYLHFCADESWESEYFFFKKDFDFYKQSTVQKS